MTITTDLKTWFKVYLKYGISQIGLRESIYALNMIYRIFLLSDMTLTLALETSFKVSEHPLTKGTLLKV